MYTGPNAGQSLKAEHKAIIGLVILLCLVGLIKSGLMTSLIRQAKLRTKGTDYLSELIRGDDYPGVVAYVETGRPIVADDRSFQPFVEACSYHTDIAWYLLKHGADPKAKDSAGDTALHAAAQGHSTRLINELVRLGIDVNAINASGETPLDSMMHTNMIDREIAYWIYQHGGRTMNPDNSAIEKSVRLMTKRQTLGVILANCFWGNRSFSEKLIREGADPNATNGLFDESLLELAVSRSSDEPILLQLLLEKGANPNTVVEFKKHRTPILHVACLLNKPDAVRMLLKHGANPQTKDSQGRTAFEAAKSAGGYGR